MSKLLAVSLVLIVLLKPTGAFPLSGLDLGGNRTRRDVRCKDLEYPNGDICCSNCPAGTRMTSPCTRAGEKGECEECNYRTYTQHSNGLRHCFPCTQCRPDQEIVTSCSLTHDTECQCKSGRFCDPDQACEVCKKCSSCKEDEAMVRPCTSTANRVCKKAQANPVSSPEAWVIALAIAAIAVVIIIVGVCIWRSRRATGSQRNLPDGLKAGLQHSDNSPSGERGNGEPQRPSGSSLTLSQLVRAKSSAGMEDERMLCESLNSSASNSQHSLTGPPSSAFPAHPPRASPMVPQQLNWRKDEPFPKLVPVNGEESLKKCFEYFEDMDVNYHKRFFRHLGIIDNVIKSKEHLLYEDKIHELLNIWVEKEGREASLNDLLKALLALNQRRTAETVKEKAIHSGQYFCEC